MVIASRFQGQHMTPLRSVACGVAATALLVSLAAVANAQQAAPAAASGQVVSTASGAPPPAPAKADDQIARWLADTSDDDVSDGPVRDHKVHGEVSVGVGTNGYREVGGIVTGPIGDDGQATIAIDAGQIGSGRR
jgi:hypothetical protein